MSGGVLDTRGNARRDLGYLDGTAKPGRDLDLTIAQLAGSTMLGEAFPYTSIAGNYTLATGTVFGTALYLPEAATISTAFFYQHIQGVFTGTTGKLGLYTSDGTNLTQVAVSANDTALFKSAASTYGSKAFSSSYAAAAGTYWLLGIWVRSAQTTAPAIGSRGVALINAGATKPANTNVCTSFTIASQTDLAASIAWSSVTASTTVVWGAVG